MGAWWGLAGYRWVHTKFWLPLITVLLSVFLLRPGISRLAAEAGAGVPAPDINLRVAPSVATVTCLFLTADSVLKPGDRPNAAADCAQHSRQRSADGEGRGGEGRGGEL